MVHQKDIFQRRSAECCLEEIEARAILAHQMVSINIGGNLSLRPVAIGEKLFLVIEELFTRFCRKLKRLCLDNSVDWTCLLAHATVNALGHINIITRRTARTIHTRLALDRNSERWANGFTQLASNATLFPRWVPTKRMLATETRADRPFFKWVLDRVWRTEEVFQGHPQATRHLGEEEKASCLFKRAETLGEVWLLLWWTHRMPAA